MAREGVRSTAGGVYDMPFLSPEYEGLYMVADDGVLLVEIKIHDRAKESDWVTFLRDWRERIREKEARSGLKLVTSEGDDEASLP